MILSHLCSYPSFPLFSLSEIDLKKKEKEKIIIASCREGSYWEALILPGCKNLAQRFIGKRKIAGTLTAKSKFSQGQTRVLAALWVAFWVRCSWLLSPGYFANSLKEVIEFQSTVLIFPHELLYLSFSCGVSYIWSCISRFILHLRRDDLFFRQSGKEGLRRVGFSVSPPICFLPPNCFCWL